VTQKGFVKDYTVTQMSLERAFLDLGRRQEEHKEAQEEGTKETYRFK